MRARYLAAEGLTLLVPTSEAGEFVDMLDEQALRVHERLHTRSPHCRSGSCRRDVLVQAVVDLAEWFARPDEPKQLGAVVRDKQGRPWVRWKLAERAPWRMEGPGDLAHLTATWDEIDVECVLSEGVES